MNISDLHHRFLQYCAIEEGLAQTTLNDLKSKIGTFIKRTEVKNINEVTTALLREFFYDGKQRYQWSAWTYENYHKYLKKFINWCIDKKYLNIKKEANPILNIQKPKKPQKLPRRLSEEDAQKILLSTFTSKWRYKYEKIRNFVMIATLLYSGLRISELLNLKIMDINFNSGTIFVRSGKGKKDRYIPLYFKLKHILENFIQESISIGKKSEYLFLNARSNKPLTRSGVKKIVNKIRQFSGVDFSPHRLRHTFASVGVEKGMGLTQMQQILGHSSIQSTMIYMQMSTKSLADGLNSLDLF